MCSEMSEKKYFEVVWSYGEREECLRKLYASETEGSRKRGRPVVR